MSNAIINLINLIEKAYTLWLAFFIITAYFNSYAALLFILSAILWVLNLKSALWVLIATLLCVGMYELDIRVSYIVIALLIHVILYPPKIIQMKIWGKLLAKNPAILKAKNAYSKASQPPPIP